MKFASMTVERLVTASAAALVCVALAGPAAAQSARAMLKDKTGKDVGSADLTQTPAGVLIKLSLKGLPAGDHAVHVHAVGKCEAPFESAGGHFNPNNQHHGFLAGEGHAGDLPTLHVPAGGELVIEMLAPKVALAKGGPTSLFDSDGASLVIHAAADDYKSDPAGNSGDRIACGVISEASAGTVGGPTGK